MAPTPSATAKTMQVSVDIEKFIHTRDALYAAYGRLSSSIKGAAEAYLAHTDTIFERAGGEINTHVLMKPFEELSAGAQSLAQSLHGKVASPEPDANGVKPKRQRRPRLKPDPDAPKRPQTAYFLYMAEQRAAIGQDLAKKNNGVPGKAGDTSKEGTLRWNAMTDAEKQPYKDAYQRDWSHYAEELKKFKDGGGKLTPGQEKHVEKYEAGEVDGDGDDETDIVAAAEKEVPPEEERAEDKEDDSDDDEEDSSEDEEEEAPAPPPRRPQGKTPKSPKSALKKGVKQEQSSSVPPGPAFSAINVPPSPAPAPTPKFSSKGAPVPLSSSPERKRKASVAEPPRQSEPTKKKRGRKSDAEKAAAQLTAEDEMATEVPAPATTEKKKKKDKKRKSLEA